MPSTMMMRRSVFVIIAATLTTSTAVEQRCTAFSTPERHPSFPPFGLTDAEIGAWFANNPQPIPTRPELSAADRKHISWSISEFIAARKRGAVSCEAYVTTLARRAEHYRSMNQLCEQGF